MKSVADPGIKPHRHQQIPAAAITNGVAFSGTIQKSPIESSENQNNSYIRHQPFPESVSEKQ
jgi:hypothetical protein